MFYSSSSESSIITRRFFVGSSSSAFFSPLSSSFFSCSLRLFAAAKNAAPGASFSSFLSSLLLLLLSSSSWSYSYSDDLVSFSFSSRVVCNVSRESSMHCDEDVFEDLLRLVSVEGISQKSLLGAGLVPDVFESIVWNE